MIKNNPDFYVYVWQRLPLILMFANSYVVYRLFVITKLTDRFVLWSLRKSRGRITWICLYITAAAALLSFFIPNAVTVLILLPVLRTVEAEIALQTKHSLSTALTLSAIYGANIGGMGSLIGSPANLLLIGALDLYGVPGREQISFFSWLIWGVPLAAIFAGAAWGLVGMLAIPKKARGMSISLGKLRNQPRLSEEQKSGGLLFILFLIFWILESVFKELIAGFTLIESPLCICFFMLFLYFSFVRSPGLGAGENPSPGSSDGGLSRGRGVLRPEDMITGFPRRGILFLVILLLFISVVRFFGLDRQAANMLSSVISGKLPVFALFFGVTVTVIFLTELLSNTVVSTAFFSFANFVALDHQMSPLSLMIAVSIASTCAFMTPVATPCNALAFGEMRGTSFRVMLVSGFLLNIIGALLMSLWLQFVIPLVYTAAV